MYFLEAADDTVPAFKRVWSTIGDSIVVVGGDGLWNCHIHTDDIGASIEAAVDIALLGRYYERIADHSVSVANRVVFVVTGERPERD